LHFISSMTIHPGKGTYALLLLAEQEVRVDVGRLGQLSGHPGHYVYIGSAFGPGGVAARLRHHFSVAARPHWHIDYLRRHTRLRAVWYTLDPVKREHLWAEAILKLPGAEIPLRGFGATDCNCPSHLMYFQSAPSFQALRASLVSIASGEARIFRCHFP